MADAGTAYAFAMAETSIATADAVGQQRTTVVSIITASC